MKGGGGGGFAAAKFKRAVITTVFFFFVFRETEMNDESSRARTKNRMKKKTFVFPTSSLLRLLLRGSEETFWIYRENGLAGMGKSWVWGKDFAEKRVGGEEEGKIVGRGESRDPSKEKRRGGNLEITRFPPFLHRTCNSIRAVTINKTPYYRKY